MIRKLACIVLAAAVAAGVLADPYTFGANSGHFRVPAPLWQTTLAILEVLLLCLYAAAIWKGRRRRAIGTLSAATMLNISLNIALVLRDGVDRFSLAFGTREYLSVYLVSLLIRVGLLVVTCLALDSELERSLQARPRSANSVRLP